MNLDFTPVLDLLQSVEDAWQEEIKKAGELACPTGCPLVLEAILVDEPIVTSDRLKTTLLAVGRLIEERDLHWTITDWPFEHFWGSPNETRHSKYLAFLLGSSEAHKCGPYLLNRLFQVTNTLGRLSFSSYEVIPERRSKEFGQIDLLIVGKCTDGREVAVIIENKVHRAKNQDGQLRRYIQQVQAERGLKSGDIFVLFLPLSEDREPNRDDMEFIKESGVSYEKITFETHIAQWLASTLEAPPTASSFPEALRAQRGMRDNLRHYEALISFLVKKQKQAEMNQKIIRQLQSLEGANKGLPSWSAVNHLISSAQELLPCLESVLRGKLLFGVREQLVALKVAPDDLAFYSTGDGVITLPETPIESPFDSQFEKEQSLCIRLNSVVSICVGACQDNEGLAFVGFLRTGGTPDQAATQEYAIQASRIFLANQNLNAPWYVWDWLEEISYDDCTDPSVARGIAQKLLAMRDALQKSIPA